MSQFIPNEHSWVGFLVGDGVHEFGVADVSNPTVGEVDAALDITDLVMSVNATTTGNTVPVPRLKRRFEPSIAGTASGSFSMDAYQDDEPGANLVVDTLPRGTKGAMIISRFGGTGSELRPAIGDVVEVWPIEVSSNGKSNMANNTPQSTTVTAAVPVEPDEEATVAA